MALFRQRGKENTAKILLEDFNASRNHSYFLGIGKSVTSPVEPIISTPDTIQADHLVWDNLFFVNQILRSDVSLMIKKYEWEPDKVYQPFNKDKNQYESDDKFYVFNTNNRRVYLCLSSPPNENAKSTYPPVGADITPEVKLDGYTWKFLYEISEEELEKFDYPGYIPVKEISTDLYTDERLYQQYVQASTVRGAIEAIDVQIQGKAYAAAVNINFENPIYAVASSTTESGSPVILIDPVGKYELVQVPGFYDKKYVIHFQDGYTAVIESSSIDSDTNLLKLVLCDPNTTNLPSASSIFTILPRIEIIGNGTGAIAVPIMTTDKLITKIKIVDSGINYSYVEAKVSVENGTLVKPLIGLNGLASDVTELLGTKHLMISKTIKPVSSLSLSDPVVYSLPENTGIVYDGNEYTNVISENTYYTQLSLLKSPKKLIDGLEEIAGTSVIEIREMTLEAINPKVTINIGNNQYPYTNSTNFFEVGDVIVRGPDNYPDQFRAVVTEITNTNPNVTNVFCDLINGSFETYSGYRIKNLKNTPTDGSDDTELFFQDCNNNCSTAISVSYQNVFTTRDFRTDNTLLGLTSFANAEIVPPTPGYGYVNPLYPTRAKIKVKNVDSGFIGSRYENGQYYYGETVDSLKIINGVSERQQSGKLVTISEPIQIIGDDNVLGYSYILECTIDRGEGQINTPDELVNSDNISLETNTLIRQGTTGSIGNIIRAAIPSGTSNTNIIYLYVNNYNGGFAINNDNLYIVDNLYNPKTYKNMKITVTDIIYAPSLVRYSGKLLYINDAGPVQRRLENTENLKLLIEF